MFQNKHILFVEDRPETVEKLIENLEDNDAKVTLFSTLEEAYNFLKNKENKIGLVLIDLNCPPIPEELQKYVKQLEMRGNTLNQGQTLGCWLSENRSEIDYAYLTAYSIAFEPNEVEGKKVNVLSKFGSDVAEEIQELLKD